MRNFFKNCLHFKWINIFKFWSNKHAGYSSQMKITNLFLSRATFEVSIKQTNSQEECLIIAFEVGQDLDHPVDHSCSKACINVMVRKSIGSIKFCLKFSQVFVNIRTQLVSHIDVLSLNIGCGFSWKLSSWMRLTHVASKHKISVIHNWKWKTA